MKYIKTFETFDDYSGPLITPMNHNAGITDSNFSVSDGRIGGEFDGGDGNSSTSSTRTTPQSLKYALRRKTNKRKKVAKILDRIARHSDDSRENEGVLFGVFSRLLSL